MSKKLLIIVFVLLFAGCAVTDDRPIVDMQGVSVAQYNTDLSDCRIYADEVEASRQVARGTIAGAVVGGAIGAVVGNSDTAQRAAGGGAVLGAARSTGDVIRERERVVRNCLRGRGYRVLN